MQKGVPSPCGYYTSDSQMPFSDDDLGTVVKACLRIESLDIAQDALALIKKSTPLSIFSELGKALSTLGFSRIESM